MSDTIETKAVEKKPYQWGDPVISDACKAEIEKRIEANQPGEFKVGCDTVTLKNEGGDWIATVALYAAGVTVTYPEPVPVVDPVE